MGRMCILLCYEMYFRLPVGLSELSDCSVDPVMSQKNRTHRKSSQPRAAALQNDELLKRRERPWTAKSEEVTPMIGRPHENLAFPCKSIQSIPRIM
ncbi:hypothetical protein cyc_07273 [Cyclospora cayetanensis]|uniref:Uncharacterized protein n=1 Tax=Cyclospora cayetanensis TaxID=88456 RepID=A0A1D3CZX7_9EIME|nr:hypothetical protein cyc_07273 [Cyclospora cayetanensis]